MMRDYNAVHKMDWLEEISPGDNPNMVQVKVRTMDGKTAVFRIATQSSLARMKKSEATQRKRRPE